MVSEALKRSGATTRMTEPGDALTDLLRSREADVVFPALHGPLGEDGCLQGLLECHHVPYVGSGVCASACASNKIIAKRLFRDAGLPVARDVTVSRHETTADAVERVLASLGPDVVVKPARRGSAIGVGFASTRKELTEALEAAFAYDSDILIEEHIQGSEITAGVLDLASPQALPLIEIRTPPDTWYDYAHRYTPGLSEHVIPAPPPPRAYQAVQESALAAHRVLGCRHLSRADFIVTADGEKPGGAPPRGKTAEPSSGRDRYLRDISRCQSSAGPPADELRKRRSRQRLSRGLSAQLVPTCLDALQPRLRRVQLPRVGQPPGRLDRKP